MEKKVVFASFKTQGTTHNPKRNRNWRFGGRSNVFFVFPKGP